ncbi:MAG TPA: M48 family metallopeptidase [Dissulfurispiraceae bacterium]|nr:M48 family metallopeptidase [Dissulfurispiraceae bacterium]
MHFVFFLILFLYILKEAIQYIAQYLNLRHMTKHGTKIPPEFEGKVDDPMLQRVQAYERDKTLFGFIASLFGNLVVILFIFAGLLNRYNSWITSLNLSFTFSGWLFFLLLSYADEILSAPFSLYTTFSIENRFGFNTMTLRLWMSDFIKSMLISTVMLSLVIFAGLSLIQWSPDFWWFWVWGFLFIFSMLVMYIAPYVIEPLFNKFSPVQDELLKDKIIELTKKAGIHASRILKVDASRRSRHSNAYFTGIGRTKRIVLYDTLLEHMDANEILSVLAHELGHWKRRHLLKTLAVFEIFSFVGIYISYKIIQSDMLLQVFDIDAGTVFVKLLLLGFVAGFLLFPLRPLANFFLRRHERQADLASYELTGDAGSMESALIKLSKENLSNFYPHPLYVALYYSHPPVSERIRYLRGLASKHDS